MANILHVERTANKITLGTTSTTIVVNPLTASKPMALNASKELESVTIGTSLDYTRPTLNTIQDIRTTATPQFTGLNIVGVEALISILDSNDANNQRVYLGDSATNGGYLDLYNVDEQSTVKIRSYGDSYIIGDVGIGLTAPKTKLTVEGTLTLKEQAAADGDTAGYGQIWIKTATPNELWFTDDAGTDHQIAFV